MKKLSRILAVLLAAALLFSCSMAFAEDFSVPKTVGAIEELPDMPDVPGMKTKNNGVTETITLTDELEYINAVWNWNWFPIEMDGTTGTYDIAANNAKFRCQQGMGTWESTWDAPWLWVDGDGDCNGGFVALDVYKTTDEDDILNWLDWADAWLDANDPHIEYEAVKYPHGVDRHSAGYKAFEFVAAEDGDEALYGPGYVGTWFASWTCDKWSEGFGTYEMTTYGGIGNGSVPSAEFAFDGMTKDGVSVKYDRFGRNTARSVTVEDSNVFGTEIAPVKTEFVWIRFVNSVGGVSYHLHTVIATYEEGDFSTIQAWYTSGGKLMQVHAAKAE
ncbi:MAG: hypothetical protein IKQ41_08960 [Clostridia bacterium]|nr:hypothetical protein [Clostridia bacterium]